MSKLQKQHSWVLKVFVSLFLMAKILAYFPGTYSTGALQLAAILLLIFYPFRYLAKSNKMRLDHVKLALALVYSINILFSLDGIFVMKLIELLLFFYFFINEGFFYFKFNLKFKKNKVMQAHILDDFENTQKHNNFAVGVDYILLFGCSMVLISELLNYMHYPLIASVPIIGYGLISIFFWFKRI